MSGPIAERYDVIAIWMEMSRRCTDLGVGLNCRQYDGLPQAGRSGRRPQEVNRSEYGNVQTSFRAPCSLEHRTSRYRRPGQTIRFGVAVHRWSRGIPIQTEHLKVTGMTCGGCTSTVTHALEAISGVDQVEVSLLGGQATVQYDERLASPAQLKSAVVGAGYGVDGSKVALGHQSKGGCCS